MESFDPGQPLAVSLRAVALTHLDAAIESARAIATEPGPAIHAVRKRIKQLRGLLHYHGGVQTLRTRQLMMDLQSLQP